MKDEVKIVCGVCGKVMGKYATYDWKPCRECGKTLCYTCNDGTSEQPECRKCRGKRWSREYQERDRLRKNTPVECRSCHKEKLPRYFENKHVPSVCKVCARKERTAQEKLTRANAKKGVVSVTYGEHPVPAKDGGHGYSYYSDQPLELGDLVEVPGTWLGGLRGNRGPNIATVVSTYSDYDGPVSRIIRIVGRAKDRAA